MLIYAAKRVGDHHCERSRKPAIADSVITVAAAAVALGFVLKGCPPYTYESCSETIGVVTAGMIGTAYLVSAVSGAVLDRCPSEAPPMTMTDLVASAITAARAADCVTVDRIEEQVRTSDPEVYRLTFVPAVPTARCPELTREGCLAHRDEVAARTHDAAGNEIGWGLRQRALARLPDCSLLPSATSAPLTDGKGAP